MTLLTIAFVVLLCLKIAGVASLTWGFVFMPLIIQAGIWFVIGALGVASRR